MSSKLPVNRLMRNKYPRMLVFGPPDTGKTYGAIKAFQRKIEECIMADITKDKWPKCWLADFDEGSSTVLDEFPEEIFESLSESYRLVETFNQFKEFRDLVLKNAKDGDFLVMDMMGQIWDDIQCHYVNELYGEEIGDYFLAQKKEIMRSKKDNDSPILDGWKDWPTIKKMHNQDIVDKFKFKRDLIQFWLAAEKPFDMKQAQKEKDQVLRTTFGPIGSRPAGEKHNPHRVHTILHLSQNGGKRYVQALKNRGRRKFPKTMIKNGESFYDVWMRESKPQ